MEDYRYGPDETKVLSDSDVRRCGDPSGQIGRELLLTNRNIVYTWETRKLIGHGARQSDTYPLSRLKTIDGVAQAKYTEGAYNAKLDLFFIDSTVSFEFRKDSKDSSKRAVSQWLDAISRQLTGRPSEEAAKLRKTIFGVEMFAGALKGTIDSFTKTFSGRDLDDGSAKTVTSKCVGCRAPLTGRQGTNVRCRYCDTEQTLQ